MPSGSVACISAFRIWLVPLTKNDTIHYFRRVGILTLFAWVVNLHSSYGAAGKIYES
jgi:hypothetical protein